MQTKNQAGFWFATQASVRNRDRHQISWRRKRCTPLTILELPVLAFETFQLTTVITGQTDLQGRTHVHMDIPLRNRHNAGFAKIFINRSTHCCTLAPSMILSSGPKMDFKRQRTVSKILK